MKNKKILIVDDYPMIRKSLTRFFKSLDLGYEISTAEDGNNALELISKETPDILITDFSMPEMNGRELINELGKKGYEFPIILNTTIEFEQIDLSRFNYKNLQYNYKSNLDGLSEKVQALG